MNKSYKLLILLFLINTSFSSSSSESAEELDDVAKITFSLQEQNLRLNKEVQDLLNKKVKMLGDRLEANQTTIEELQSKLDELSSLKDTLESTQSSSAEKYTHETSALKSQIDILTKTLTEEKERESVLLLQKTDFEKEIESLKRQNEETIENDKIAMQQQKDSYDKKINELTASVEEEKEKEKELEKEKNSLQEKLQKAEETIKTTNATFEKTRKQLEKENKMLEEANEELQKQIEGLKSDSPLVTPPLSAISEKEELIEKINKKIKELETRKNALDRELLSREDSTFLKTEEVTELEEKIQQIRESFDQVKEDFENKNKLLEKLEKIDEYVKNRTFTFSHESYD